MARDGRPSAHRRGYGKKWAEAARLFLRRTPFCRYCLLEGVETIATDVDHIDPHRGNQAKFWDRSNWQALCKRCHTRKSAEGL